MYPIFNKPRFNWNGGIKNTYFKLKYFLRDSLRVQHWSSVISVLTCSWSTWTKCFFYIRFLLTMLNSTSKLVNFVISSLWWLPVTCPPRTLWHIRMLSIKPYLHTQLQKHNRSYWKVLTAISVIFPGLGAFDQLKWTYDEAFEQLFSQGRGVGGLNKNFPKFKCPGGMLKLRFDW